MRRNALALAILASVLPLAAGANELREAVPVALGGALEIDLDGGSVEVETHDEPEVQVDAHWKGWGSGSMSFDLTSDGSDARLVGESRGWLFGASSARVRVRVPETFSVEVRTRGGSIEVDDLDGQVRAYTSGGRIEIDGARGSVDLETSGGSIRAESIEGDISVRTSGGPIRIAEVSGRVEAETSGGSIRIHDVGGPVYAHTSGGSIEVRFIGDRDPEGDLETSGGSIEAEFPEEAGVNLDASTSGGRVHIDDDLTFEGQIERSHVAGSINEGGPELRLRTSGGNVRVSAD